MSQRYVGDAFWLHTVEWVYRGELTLMQAVSRVDVPVVKDPLTDAVARLSKAKDAYNTA